MLLRLFNEKWDRAEVKNDKTFMYGCLNLEDSEKYTYHLQISRTLKVGESGVKDGKTFDEESES